MSPSLAIAVACLTFAAEVPDGNSPARNVIRAVTDRAAKLRNSTKPKTDDDLTVEYVRAAANAAMELPEVDRVRAFLLGLGVTLDDSALLRDNPLTRRIVRAVETDAERTARLVVLGRPTLRGRRDWCQHFAVSAALAEVLGPAAAEGAGIAKEILDMTSPDGSGFSFADLAANAAGIAFARKLKENPDTLRELATGFRVVDFVPDLDDLADGLTESEFRTKYGSVDDPRFRAELERVKQRVTK